MAHFMRAVFCAACLSSASALRVQQQSMRVQQQSLAGLARTSSPVRHASAALQRSSPARYASAAPQRSSPAMMYGGGGPQYRLGGGGPGFDPSSLIGPAIFAGLFFSGALGWIFNFVIGIQLLLFLLPVVGVPLFQWYVKQNLLEGRCPTCSVDVQTFKGQTNQCMQCGTVYTSELVDGMFLRQPSQTGEGVIEVEVIQDEPDPWMNPPSKDR